MNHGALAHEQQTCSALGTRHERLLVLI